MFFWSCLWEKALLYGYHCGCYWHFRWAACQSHTQWRLLDYENGPVEKSSRICKKLYEVGEVGGVRALVQCIESSAHDQILIPVFKKGFSGLHTNAPFSSCVLNESERNKDTFRVKVFPNATQLIYKKRQFLNNYQRNSVNIHRS